MKARIERAAGRWWLAVGVGALCLAGASLWRGSGEGFGLPEALVETARADIGKGDYLFLPNRFSMWVVNRTNGKVIHYQFFDNQVGTVERSRIAQVSADLFPPADTEYMLSDRNMTAHLWVVNRATGDFQVWRANRDGSITTDEVPVQAGEHLREEPTGRLNSGPPPKRPPADIDEETPRKKIEPKIPRKNG
jgi:hypothetical protein